MFPEKYLAVSTEIQQDTCGNEQGRLHTPVDIQGILTEIIGMYMDSSAYLHAYLQ